LSGGTVNISRDLWDDEAFRDATFSEREAWIWMIAEASWKPRKKRVGDRVVDLERGQLAASLRFMAGAWDWTDSKVRRFLDKLSKREMVSTKTDAGVTVVTICNYDKYQSAGRSTDAGPTQDRRRTDANEKKGEIRDYSEANASDADASPPAEPEDFAKELFDRGVAFLSRHGTNDRQARAIIGKWRRDHDDERIFAAFKACSAAGVTDPVPWIVRRLGQGPPPKVDMDAIFKAVAEGTVHQ
jgi:hypothetical protein